MAGKRTHQKTCLLAFADGGAVIQRVVTARFDGVEDGDAAAAEHFEIHAEAPIDHFCERIAFRKKLARASDQVLHQSNVAIAELAIDDFAFIYTVLRSDIE